MDDDDEPASESPAGLPGWLATFADLMSLLMCFFVLLLSMADTNAAKFKRLAGSMQNAFGVQSELQVIAVPKGTSIIAQEFSPGTPDETAINQIWQKTTDDNKLSLDTGEQGEGSADRGDTGDSRILVKDSETKDLVGDTEEEAARVAGVLEAEIDDGRLEIETAGRRIILRIKDHGTFASGSAEITAQFAPVIANIRGAIAETPGRVEVQGHTDSDPIRSARFRSNWDLSSARAVSVAHGLFGDGALAERNFVVSGFADTQPLAPNDSPADKARNRRVEVIIDQAGVAPRRRGTGPQRGERAPASDIEEQQEPVIFDDFQLKPEELFGMSVSK